MNFMQTDDVSTVQSKIKKFPRKRIRLEKINKIHLDFFVRVWYIWVH